MASHAAQRHLPLRIGQEVQALPRQGLSGPLAAPGGRLRRLAPGEVLFREGDKARAIAQVVEGRLVLRRHLADGAELVIDHLGAGDLVAEGALVHPRYGCEVAALGAATVMVVATASLRAAMAVDAAVAASLIAAMASRVHRLRMRLALRAMRPARRRVLAALAIEAAGDPPAVTIEGPLAAFADAIGLSPPAFYRTLAVLERSGEIARTPGRITLRPVSPEDATSLPSPERAHRHAPTASGRR